VNTNEHVAKLEALLARVNGRRGAPRVPVASDSEPTLYSTREPAHAAVAPPLVHPATPKPAPVEAKPAPITPPPAPVEARLAPTVAKPAPAPPAPPTPKPSPVEARPAPAAAKSPAPPVVEAAARPAAQTSPPPHAVTSTVDVEVEVEEGEAEVDLEGIDEAEGVDALLSDSVADLDQVAGPLEEEVPASSRRPIQLEPPLAERAFSDSAPPPHPVPPESGRQVAVAEFDGDLSGVRSAPAAEPCQRKAHKMRANGFRVAILVR